MEDRFIRESNKKNKAGSGKPATVYKSEQRSAYEWPDPSKSRDVNSRATAPTFSVPPVAVYENRIELDKSQPAGLRSHTGQQSLNFHHCDGAAASYLPKSMYSATNMPPTHLHRSVGQ